MTTKTDEQTIIDSIIAAPAAATADGPAATDEKKALDSEASGPEGVAPTGAADGTPTKEGAGEADDTAGSDADDEGDFDDPFAETGTDEKPDDDADDEDDAGEDDLYTVKVDGKDVQVTLATLLKNYSAEGAIERRLQEATEKRTQADAEMQAARQEKAALEAERIAERGKVAAALKAVKTLLMQPAVPAPDPKLEQTNPGLYAAQMLKHQQDQARVARYGQMVDEAVAAHEADASKASEIPVEVKQQEAVKLVTAIPALRDAKRAPAVMNVITETARAAGFSDDEIGAAVDHRMYVLALKAGLYDRMVAKTAVKPTVTGGTMKPGGKRPRKTAVTQDHKTLQRAQEGDEDAIVSSMILGAPKRR